MFKKLLLCSLVILIAIGSRLYGQTEPVDGCAYSTTNMEVCTTFVLNNVSYPAPAATAYLDLRNSPIDCSSGDVFTFTANGFIYNNGASIDDNAISWFIDINRNGTFETNERVYSDGVAYLHTASFTIPAGLTGRYLMRYVSDDGAGSTLLTTGCSTTDNYTECRDFIINVAPPVPQLLSILPAKNTVLQFEQNYSTTNKPAIHYRRSADQDVVYFKYFIYGGSNGDTIYKATNPGTTDNFFVGPISGTGSDILLDINSAIGFATDYNSTTPTLTGNLNLIGKSNQISGGAYTAKCKLYYGNTSNEIGSIENSIVLALDKDLACLEIDAPQPNTLQKYSRTAGSIPVRVRVGNVGIQPITDYLVIAKITNVATGQVVKLDTIHFVNDTIRTGDTKLHSFPSYTPTGIGDFRVEFMSILQSPIPDNQMANNYLPLQGAKPFIFSVYHDYDGKADTIISPPDVNYIGRPIKCSARMSNLGTKLISAAGALMIILDADGQEVFRQPVSDLPDIPTGRYNQITAYFDQEAYIPSTAGLYTAVFIVSVDYDGVRQNDTCRKTFRVVNSMCGDYTIGKKYLNAENNFATVQEAVNALYKLGVTCPVVFTLTDSLYYVGSATAGLPALDMSSRIIGLGPINTISFVPSEERANTPQGVSIQLNSGNGVGIVFGQNEKPTNPLAPIFQVSSTSKRDYANNPMGATYITFDGGANKKLKFSVKSNSQSRAVFYLAQGTSNLTIRNCVITDSVTSTAYKTCANIPYNRFNNALNRLEYDADFQNGKPLSVGVYLRSVPPLDVKNSINTNHLDTLVNRANTIENNIITNFAIGIASIGVGPVKDDGEGIFVSKYNSGNKYSGNTIYNVGKAGLFLGFEEYSTVSNNRIDSVYIVGSQDVMGVLAGLPSAVDASQVLNFGYHNVGLTIDGNEISNVITSNGSSSGVKIEQCITGYPSFDPISHESIVVKFPNVDDNFTVINNTIWNFTATPSAPKTIRLGVSISSERYPGASVTSYQPKEKDYYVKGNKVSNNTIVVSNNVPTGGSTRKKITTSAAIFLAQVRNSEIKNNAIAMVDSICINQDFYAGLLFVGLKPSECGMVFDRNIIQLDTSKIIASWARFIETDSLSNILEGADSISAYNYRSVEQWRNWTGMDLNSINGNFLKDMRYVTNERNTSLRMVDNPSQGCLLEARGDRLPYVGTDLLGNLRGPANRRYDAGAFEFSGVMYEDDAEIIAISAPASWQASTGLFKDAEYIMAKGPIDVKARIRNNSSKPKVALVVRTSIFQQNADGTFPTEPTFGPFSKTMGKIESAEIAEVSFGLDDTAATAPKFMPASYSQLGIAAPAMFNSMRANVTPVYQIKVEIVDNQILNNTMKKNVRFYIKHSKTDWILSAENTNFNIATAGANDKDAIAGRLNSDSLINAFNNIGWTVYPQNVDSSWVDIFDRLSWEPKNVNYKNYRFIIWSDGDDKELKRYELINIRDYLNAGTTAIGGKKNIAFGSQEMLRMNYTIDYPFTSTILNADTTARLNPLGNNVSYDGNRILGKTIRSYFTDLIKATGVANDPAPYCGLMKVSATPIGDARRAYVYKSKVAGTPVADSAAGVTTRGLTRNVVYLGIDWRHFGKLSDMLSGLYDFLSPEDLLPPPVGPVPVELTAFKANYRNRNVEVIWTTASEIRTSRFEVERREDSEAAFAKVAELKAVGGENIGANYGPVIDNSVVSGKTYHYRLRSVDVDGTFEYSSVETIDIPAASEWIGNAQPNPAMNNVRFEFNTNGNASVAEIYDFSGNLVSSIQIANGDKFIDADVTSFVAGVYTVVVKSTDTVLKRQFVVVK